MSETHPMQHHDLEPQPMEALYIHGHPVEATSGKTFASVNPATGDTLCRVQVASGSDVNRAVESAREGQRVWATITGAERGRILGRAARLLRERNDELARLEVLDTGKPISEATEVDIQTGADAIEYYAGLAAGIHGHHYDLGGPVAYTRREPLGVCAGTGAWNYPLQIACWKSGPALACGNAFIFKPAELTPLTALRLAAIYTDAGVPDGVFNVVQGMSDTGRALSTHPDIAKVSLTGEVGTGKKVMADAAGTLKDVTMELGGKSPLIVFADADIDNAVSAALIGNFYTQGEVCTNGTRVFVHRAIREEFIERLLERTQRIRIGDPLDPDTQLGALISAEHMQLVLDYIDAGKRDGATLLHGGERVTGNGLDAGCFVEPTIFTDCSDDMTIVREEIFGPVMAV